MESNRNLTKQILELNELQIEFFKKWLQEKDHDNSHSQPGTVKLSIEMFSKYISGHPFSNLEKNQFCILLGSLQTHLQPDETINHIIDELKKKFATKAFIFSKSSLATKKENEVEIDHSISKNQTPIINTCSSIDSKTFGLQKKPSAFTEEQLMFINTVKRTSVLIAEKNHKDAFTLLIAALNQLRVLRTELEKAGLNVKELELGLKKNLGIECCMLFTPSYIQENCQSDEEIKALAKVILSCIDDAKTLQFPTNVMLTISLIVLLFNVFRQLPEAHKDKYLIVFDILRHSRELFLSLPDTEDVKVHKDKVTYFFLLTASLLIDHHTRKGFQEDPHMKRTSLMTAIYYYDNYIKDISQTLTPVQKNQMDPDQRIQDAKCELERMDVENLLNFGFTTTTHANFFQAPQEVQAAENGPLIAPPNVVGDSKEEVEEVEEDSDTEEFNYEKSEEADKQTQDSETESTEMSERQTKRQKRKK